MAFVTFIIPTVGRSTLKRALDSLYNQTDKDWKAVVCFDTVQPTMESTDEVTVTRFSGQISLCDRRWRAGAVRNFALNYVDTVWTAMLDDDDTVTKDYVKCLREHVAQNPDVVVFKMQYDSGKILPTRPLIFRGHIGISFAAKTNVVKDIRFETMKCEDYYFLKKAQAKKFNICFSPHVTYHVKYY